MSNKYFKHFLKNIIPAIYATVQADTNVASIFIPVDNFSVILIPPFTKRIALFAMLIPFPPTKQDN